MSFIFRRSSVSKGSILNSKSRSLDADLVKVRDDDKNPLVNVGGEASDSDEQVVEVYLIM